MTVMASEVDIDFETQITEENLEEISNEENSDAFENIAEPVSDVSDGVENGNVSESYEEGNIISYVGMNLNEFELPENAIVQYEILDNPELNDIVLQQSINEEGVLVLTVGTLPPQIVEEGSMHVSLFNSFALGAAPSGEEPSNVMGINWDSVPANYEFNWDNSENCWEYGVWINGVCYKTPRGTYNTDVRHKIQMYSDGSNVYLRIVFAREFSSGQVANSNDYNFYFDNNYVAKYRVPGMTGQSYEPGVYYNFQVAHGDGPISGQIASGAEAIYRVTPDSANNEIYLKIPFDTFEAQTGKSLENVQTISYFSPNLMHDASKPVTCAGSSTGGTLLAVGLFAVVGGSFAIKGKESTKDGRD